MKINKKFFAILTMPITLLGIFFVGSSTANAVSLNYTDRPMDDTIFRASYTMSAADIQNFLVSKNSGLANFTDVENCGSTSGSHYAFYATYYHCGTVQRASQIIYDASQAYGINPQAILATLQKEQSLITTPNPTSSQVNFAMGYGCPDSGGCTTSGFFNQVDNGTWQFRTDYELSSGNNYWGYGPSSYPCNGATRYYNNRLVPGQDVIFIDDYGTGYARFVIPNASTATLYCYTPHVYPGSARQYYSGSYWFVYYFSQWFGGTITPYAFKSSTGTTIYINVNGFKVAVPDFALLQDFGISPQSVKIVSQANVDAMPTPSVAANGISPTLSYVFKSSSDSDNDGGAVYLESVGKKNAFVSMSQFTGFGFDTSQISYLPLTYIASLDGNESLYNYVVSPTSNVFQVNVNKKRIIFDYPTYASLNPNDKHTLFSYNLINRLASGTPITGREILVRSTQGTTYLYVNNAYYYVPSTEAFNCWGFSGPLATPSYQLGEDSYIGDIGSPSSLSCLANIGQPTPYLLNDSNKVQVPASYSLSAPLLGSDLVNLVNKLATRSSQLGRAIKSAGATIWYVEDGVKKPIPSMSDLSLLGYSLAQIDIVNNGVTAYIPTQSVKIGVGQVVKTNDSGTVFVVNSNNSRIAFESGDDFTAYGYPWSAIESFSAATLDAAYPAASGQTIKKYLYDSGLNKIFLMDSAGCYGLNSQQVTSFGQNSSSVQSSQSYSSSIFPNISLGICRPASDYAKSPNSNTVYWIDGGQKHPVTSWTRLQEHSGQSNPSIITLSNATLSTLSTGSSL